MSAANPCSLDDILLVILTDYIKGFNGPADGCSWLDA